MHLPECWLISNLLTNILCDRTKIFLTSLSIFTLFPISIIHIFLSIIHICSIYIISIQVNGCLKVSKYIYRDNLEAKYNQSLGPSLVCSQSWLHRLQRCNKNFVLVTIESRGEVFVFVTFSTAGTKHGREAWQQAGVAAKLQLRAHILEQEKENKLRAKPCALKAPSLSVAYFL